MCGCVSPISHVWVSPISNVWAYLLLMCGCHLLLMYMCGCHLLLMYGQLGIPITHVVMCGHTYSAGGQEDAA